MGGTRHGGVFVNYRTGDGEFAATLVSRVLSERFGPEYVFLASRSIRPGEDFASTILERLAHSDVLLAIIGARWRSITERQSRREAEAPDDWVHREIAEAFRHGLRVIPVFLDHAVPLVEAELPPDIAPLARCQFLRLSHRNDARDLAKLVEELGGLVPDLVLRRVFTGSPPRSRTLPPSTWLLPEYGIAPFAGRDLELAELTGWVRAPRPVSAQLVTGPAGRGKTRLALRLCAELDGHGWVTGIVHDNARIADLAALGTIDSPLLVVVDQASTRFEQLHALAAALVERDATAPPARLLLLDRENGEWARRLRTHTTGPVAGLFRDLGELELAPAALTTADRRTEFHRAAAAYAEFLELPATELRPPDDLAHSRYSSARVLHATALVALLEEHRGDSVPAPDPELHRTARPECPYRGLRPFQERDSRFFWGRDQQVRQLETLLEQHPTVVVTGASGSGKSSLVRAGLLPVLRERGIVVTVLRPTAGVEPLELLANAVAPLVGDPGRDVLRLADAIVDAAGHWVLFVDQFEELVAADPEAADRLLELVVELVRAGPPRPGGTPALRAVFTALSSEHPHTLALPRMGPAELRAAIAGPAELVSFEPGLVDRIIADAADAPGQLPLVELTVTRLWESAQGGTLSHRAYDEQGGLAGALAGYADEVCSQRLEPGELEVAERLLVQLARPGEDGTFTLTPVRLDQLDPAARDLAGTLAGHRLVVLRAGADQPETVVLAHEGLVQRWRRLHEWLVAAQDFRSWQEQLRSALRQWQRAGRDPGVLLRGASLAAAEDWLASHPPRLTGEEKDFITASRRHERREARRWRVITALVAVLALVATSLAVAAGTRNRELAEQFRRTTAVSLGQEAQRRTDSDPSTALQLAQASWRQDETAPEAYAALLQHYLDLIDVDHRRPGLWSGTVTTVVSSADGRVTAGAERNGKVTVWTGLFGSEPEPWTVAIVPDLVGLTLSQDGRWLAVASRRGTVTLWDVDRRAGPVRLRPPEDPYASQEPDSLFSAGFSTDGRLLVVTLRGSSAARAAGRSSLVETWDVSRPDDARSGFSVGAPVDTAAVLRVDQDGRSAWFGELHVDGSRHNVRRDLVTGAALDTTSDGVLTPGGLLVDCAGSAAPYRLSVRDAVTEALRFSRPVPRCPPPVALGVTDLSGRYALVDDGSAEDSFRQLTLVDLETADAYSVRRPSRPGPVDDLTVSNNDPVIALPSGSGPPAVFLLDTDALLRLRPVGPVGDLTGSGPARDPGLRALSPDGRLLVTMARRRLLAFDLAAGRRLEADGTAGDPRLAADPQLVFTEDGKHVLAVGDRGELVVLSVPDLVQERRISLGVPAFEVQSPPAVVPISLVPLFDDEVAVVRGTSVAKWDTSSGEQLTDWLDLRGGAATQLRDFARDATVTALPQANLLLVASQDGAEIWNLASGVLVRSFQPRPGTASAVLPQFGTSRVALHYQGEGELELWDWDANRSTTLLVPGDLSLVAFTPDGKLVTDSGTGTLRLWDAATGVPVASLRTPTATSSWWPRDGSLVAVSTSRPLSIDLNPQAWFDHLCRLNHRDYTPEERELVPSGVDLPPPCPSS
ncbi:nSTAND1 domain-containing NTPase [Actinophytocola xanthii]|uniref:TIR domain-containing protein n=1 Tax=Actinophytocola xanthii TaxID=1912961 RepID=A0A1Q8C7M3_9PSEU|nr:AAA family ATPase [Actinophytocola xanthii]OLF10369.1 hypothetical protein BU204_31695 [Actinophytocola xanthii]